MITRTGKNSQFPCQLVQDQLVKDNINISGLGNGFRPGCIWLRKVDHLSPDYFQE